MGKFLGKRRAVELMDAFTSSIFTFFGSPAHGDAASACHPQPYLLFLIYVFNKINKKKTNYFKNM